MNKKLFDWLYIILIVAVIFTCLYIVFFLYSESSKCLKDPLVYHQEKLGENQKCYCFDMNPYGVEK